MPTIPFSKGYPRLGQLERDVYFAPLIAVVSSVLLIARSAYPPRVFRHHDKEYLIKQATRMALLGMGALAVSVMCAVFVISDFIYGGVAAASPQRL